MVAVKRKTQEQRTDLSDSLMLDAAICLMVKRGIGKTTLKEVGELAGYSRGLAGYRFGSKAGLCEFVTRSISEKWVLALKQATADLVGIEAIEAAVDAHHRFCVDEPDYSRVFYMLWFESVNPQSEVRSIMTSIRRRRHKDVARWVDVAIAQGKLSPMVDANAASGLFAAAIVGIAYQWLINPNEMDRLTNLYHNLKRSMRLLLNA